MKRWCVAGLLALMTGCFPGSDSTGFVDQSAEPIDDPFNAGPGEFCRATPDCETGLRCLSEGGFQFCVETCTRDDQCLNGDRCLDANDPGEGWCGQSVFADGFNAGDGGFGDDGFGDDGFDDDGFDDDDFDDDGFDDGPVSGNCGGPLESRQFELLNQDRLANGLPALRCDLRVAAVARDHSRDMAERDYFDHTNPDGEQPWDRLNRAGVTGWRSAGENIAAGYPTPEAVQEGWMNSPGHRANILSDGYTHVGVGLFDHNGKLFWTQVFVTF